MADLPLVYGKIADALSEIDSIEKNNTNSFQGFKFRGIDDIYNGLHKVFAKHKLFTIPEVLEERMEERVGKDDKALFFRILKIKYTVYAEDGSSVYGIVIGEGMDKGDKAATKAMAIAHKYFLLQLFAIPTEDQKDPDREVFSIVSKQADPAFQQHVEAIKQSLQNAKNLEDLKQKFKMASEFLKQNPSQQLKKELTLIKDNKKLDFEDVRI